MPFISRRQLLVFGAVAGASAIVPAWVQLSSATRSRQLSLFGAIDPTTVPKYTTTMPIPAAMPQAGAFSGYDYYEIAASYFNQQILPSGFPSTPVFGYGAVGQASTFSVPGFTVEATANRPVRVKWVNRLVNSANQYVSPLVQVHPDWHWANPPGGTNGEDGHGTGTTYTGPTPIVPHLHGTHTYHWSDGYPEAWFLPAASNIPNGYATVGSRYNEYNGNSQSTIGVPWGAGYSVYQYTNDQAATTLWYHDHALGVTHGNVQAGLAGFYLLRGGSGDLPTGTLPGPAPRRR
jgi:bilirubin oxidase